ncbi:MAG: clostripain-related cysteine peptidase [Candidatus Fimivivens sp.]|nr:clostripain-related cysteine peptidase [Candidatus Fimivivens sp.]
MKKCIAVFLAFSIMFLLSACGEEESPPSASTSSSGSATEVSTDTEWAVYWYLCGSDLESNYGSATNDLAEMMEVQLPENVKIIIQTGGTSAWQNDVVSSTALQRFVYDQDGMKLVEELPSANMGDAQTLKDFLAFSKENYPAKHTAVTLWNHGGGSVTGAAFDELYEMDSLSLAEMYQSFTEVFGENPQDQPVDIIGFDTCLMATVDVAYTFSDIGKYLVASQEVEPGNGWYYSGWMGAIAQNPAIEPLDLAKVICDSYVEGCKEVGTESNITLSVTDLSKVGNLIAAYDDFGKEALSSAAENSAFFAHFSKIANGVENYGGNTREQGYTNMADLGNLAEKSSALLPATSPAVLNALADCVAYKVNGKYRPESAGLSCYYSYNGDVDDFNAYADIGPSDSFKYFYAYGLTGTLSEQGMDYLSQMNYNSLPELKTLNSVNWQDMPVTVDESGNATLTLGPEAIDILSSLTFELYYADPEEDIMLCLGTDNDIIADWDNGVFKDNFRGVWGSLDGALCYMEIAYEGDGYNQYSVPILLNGEDYNLMVIYDFGTEEYYIEGARKPLDESGAADKNLRYLVEGDEIQTVHYAMALSDDSDELMAVPIDTIKVTPETAFAETELGDGLFVMLYAMKDSQGNVVNSAAATFKSSNGEIYTSVA